MKIKKNILLTFLLFSSLSLSANEYYIAATVLNVRTGKGSGYSIAFTLQKGDEVKVLSKNNIWYQIDYQGKVGYAYSKYLKPSTSISDLRLNTSGQMKLYFPLGFFIVLTFIITFVFLRYRKDKKLLETVTEVSRGTKTERELILKLLKFGMPPNILFHDLYVKKQSGGFSQIDMVAVTEVGIIVFEVKDYSGWLFGSGNQSYWTQVLAYGKKKYRFYNPIMQNSKHATELKKQSIELQGLPFFSLVVFFGNCVLKEINFVPHQTFLLKSARVLGVMKRILKENKAVHYHNREEVFRVLKEAVTNGGIIENQTQHKENIKNMLGKHRIFD